MMQRMGVVGFSVERQGKYGEACRKSQEGNFAEKSNETYKFEAHQYGHFPPVRLWFTRSGYKTKGPTDNMPAGPRVSPSCRLTAQ
jgi:hypothetical protein